MWVSWTNTSILLKVHPNSIYLLHFVNFQCGSEKNTAQSRTVIVIHTMPMMQVMYEVMIFYDELELLLALLRCYQRQDCEGFN